MNVVMSSERIFLLSKYQTNVCTAGRYVYLSTVLIRQCDRLISRVLLSVCKV